MADETPSARDHPAPSVGTPAMEVEPSMIGTPFVPMADPIAESGEAGPFPSPEVGATELLPVRPPELEPRPWPGPWPPFPICWINLQAGCYRITYRPNRGFYVYRGTMRVDPHGGTTTVSGDLYRFFDFPI